MVGSGICGAATAFWLNHAGSRVLLLERENRLVPGTGGRGSRVVPGTTGVGEGNVLVADAPGGHAVWHELAERFPGAVKLRAKGSLTVGHDLAGVPGQHVAEARELEPALRPGFEGVYAEGDLQVDPRGTARALAAAVPHRTGAEVVEAGPRGVRLRDGERIAADAVVLALGPWTSALAPELDVRPRRGQIVALGPAPGLVRHKVIDAAYPARVAAVIEEAITGEVYVGSTREDVGFDPDAPHQAALIARAVHFMPALADLAVTRTWVGYRPYRPAGPFVGRMDSGVYAITGHEGAGVGLGPLHARQLARAIAES